MHRRLLAQPKTPIAILSYHQTAPASPEQSRNKLVLQPRTFSTQMSLLHLMGYRGLSLRDLEPYLRGEREGRVFGVTLDDGYANNVEHALPVLSRLGFTATSFVVTGQIGGSNVWDHALGIAPSPLMDRELMRKWVDAGMEIGGHTRSHIRLEECDDRTARDEILGCKADLEDILGESVRSFCYPHGAWLPRHVEVVREAGFVLATTIEEGRASDRSELLTLPRISVQSTDSVARLLARVASPLEEWRPRLRALRHRLEAIGRRVPGV